jgi:hypothetical protein
MNGPGILRRTISAFVLAPCLDAHATIPTMNPLLLNILASIALCSSSLATDEITIQAKDAAQHVGETLVVHGTVADVHQFKGGSIVLDFGAKYPNHVFPIYVILAKSIFSTIVFNSNTERLGNTFFRTVCLKGAVSYA